MTFNGSKKRTGREAAGCCLLMAVGVVGYFAVLSLVFQFLWNLVVPGVFGGPYIQLHESIAIIGILTIISGLFRSTYTVSKS